MKVLNPGNENKWAIKIKCTGEGNRQEYKACGALLLVEEEDIFITQSNVRDEVTTYFTIQCPQCLTNTDIPDDKIPRKIRLNIHKNNK